MKILFIFYHIIKFAFKNNYNMGSKTPLNSKLGLIDFIKTADRESSWKKQPSINSPGSGGRPGVQYS